MTTNDTTGPRIPPHILWPGLVCAILAMSLASGAITITVATSDPSHAIVPDYYDKALAWDASAAEQRASDELGWSADVGIGAGADVFDHRTVTLTLTDAAGAPIEDAAVSVTAFHKARSAQREQVALQPTAPGVYGAEVAVKRVGSWVLEITATRGDDVFVTTRPVWVFAPKDGS